MPVIVEIGCSNPFRHRALRTMFEDRKRVFVDLLKWDLPVLENRFELDQFDGTDATYLILADHDGDHLASARLLPTSRAHILGALFPGLCASPPPTGPDIVEITRFCLSPRTGSRVRRQLRRQLVSALVQHALDQGIRTYTGVAELSWLQQVLAFGWDCRPLGAPLKSQCGLIGALAIEIAAETPALLAANHMWDPPSPLPIAIPQAA